MVISRKRSWSLAACVLAACLPAGCALVDVKTVDSDDYFSQRRADVLSSGHPSAATRETLNVLGLESGPCARRDEACILALKEAAGVSDERRQAALAELWLEIADARAGDPDPAGDRTAAARTEIARSIEPWLEAARHAYAYLFLSGRPPGDRAFEDRQTQVRDYYSFAVAQAAERIFRAVQASPVDAWQGPDRLLSLGKWSIDVDLSGIRIPDGVDMPEELLAADSLSFDGIRTTYRRDGFGAEMVAVMHDPLAGTRAAGAPLPEATVSPSSRRPFSEMPTPALSVLFRFGGGSLDEAMQTSSLKVEIRDPYAHAYARLQGVEVPLSANFTAGYGLWLARSGFAAHAIRTALGRDGGLLGPHIYLMQPYDPGRRIILLIHGLASSPEAWVNVANEILGDEMLREKFQMWQVYYPTNMPLAWNRRAIEDAVTRTLDDLDPEGDDPASRGMVLIGHSMGGVLARLLVSSSGSAFTDALEKNGHARSGGKPSARFRNEASRVLEFEPLPGATRAIFLAAPHRGTQVAGSRVGRLASRIVRLPLTVLRGAGEALRALAGIGAPVGPGAGRAPNGIDNLREDDPFVRIAADLPISPGVRYHSIIAVRDDTAPLPEATDGLVPYLSAHLPGAQSEVVIESGHSVQERPEAILEIRKILHESNGTQLP